jgi:hypothetical protein
VRLVCISKISEKLILPINITPKSNIAKRATADPLSLSKFSQQACHGKKTKWRNTDAAKIWTGDRE